MNSPADQATIDGKAMVQLLTSNKPQILALLDFVHDNKAQVGGFLHYFRENVDGLEKIVALSNTPGEKEKLLAMMPDNSPERKSLSFLLAHPDEMKTLTSFLKSNGQKLESASQFAANHTADLRRIINFASSHPKEMNSIIDLCAKNPDGTITLKDLIKNPRLGFFAMLNFGELNFINQFNKKYSNELSNFAFGDADDLKELQKVTTFITQNQNQIPTFIQGSDQLQKKLAPVIAAHQAEALRQQEKDKQERIAREAKERQLIQAQCPDLAARLLDLDMATKELLSGNPRPGLSDLISVTKERQAISTELIHRGCAQKTH